MLRPVAPVGWIVAGALAVCAGSLVQAQDPAKPQTYAGLEVSVTGVERAASVSLQDCPPGENTQRGMTKPNEEFAVVTMHFKVLPNFKPTMLKRPELHDARDNTYYTAVSFVDVGATPEFSCAFPFRVPKGTQLKDLQLDQLTFDLSGLQEKGS